MASIKSEKEANHIHLIYLSIGCTCLYLLMLILNLISKDIKIIWIPNLITAISCSISIILAQFNKDTIAKFIILSIQPLYILFFVTFIGQFLSLEYYLLAMAFMPVLIINKTKTIIVIISIYMALFIYSRISYSFIEPIYIPEWPANTTLIKDIIINSILISIIVIIQTGKARLLNKVKENSQTINTLLKILGHDLKAPIGMSKNLSHLLYEKEHAKEKERELQLNILKSSTSASYILDNILNWVVSQENLDPQKNDDIYLNDIIDQEIHNLEYLLLDNSKSIKKKDGDLIRIVSNKDLLSIIIRNLIQNALKYALNDSEILIHLQKDNTAASLTIINKSEKHHYERLLKIMENQENTIQNKNTGRFGLHLTRFLCNKLDLNLDIKSIDSNSISVRLCLPLNTE